jgi:hypothetical protein
VQKGKKSEEKRNNHVSVGYIAIPALLFKNKLKLFLRPSCYFFQLTLHHANRWEIRENKPRKAASDEFDVAANSMTTL